MTVNVFSIHSPRSYDTSLITSFGNYALHIRFRKLFPQHSYAILIYAPLFLKIIFNFFNLVLHFSFNNSIVCFLFYVNFYFLKRKKEEKIHFFYISFPLLSLFKISFYRSFIIFLSFLSIFITIYKMNGNLLEKNDFCLCFIPRSFFILPQNNKKSNLTIL